MRTEFIPLIALLALSAAGCRQDMHDQPKYIPLRPSGFFADGRSARPLPEHTIARGHLQEDTLLFTGKGADGKDSSVFPFPVTGEVIERGRDRFNIYCTPCHGQLGMGNGMITKRGFRNPPSYHIDRLRKAPPGYMFDVITNGAGAMQDYSAQVDVKDRWAIVAYIKVLQYSQNASLTDIPADMQEQLKQAQSKEAQAEASPKGGHKE